MLTRSISSLVFKQDVLLASLTTFQVGKGRADYYVQISESEDLVKIVKLARELKIPFRVIAGGSNLVFGDTDYHGLLIQFLAKTKSNKKAKISLRNSGSKASLIVPASLTLMSLIQSSIEQGLAGLEALSGIPGTVGGALVGNAGAYGQAISDRLLRVQILDLAKLPHPHPSPKEKGSNFSPSPLGRGEGWGQKEIHWLSKSDCKFAYRNSIFKTKLAKDWLILSAKFLLEPGNKIELQKKSREIIQTRLKRYPKNLKCPGSFFKNVLVRDVSKKSLQKIEPEKIRDGKINAGWLLEKSGVLDMRIGGVAVSDWHGNLIINDGGGTGEDVKKLADLLKNKVYKKFGIKLEEEVRYLT